MRLRHLSYFSRLKFTSMAEAFDIKFSHGSQQGHVVKSPFTHTVLREESYSVVVDSIPLVEYFVVIDSPEKSEQVKVKLYKTAADNKWYDKSYSEEAEWNSPEFGAYLLNKEIKSAIESYESRNAGVKNYA
jgi:hypothetical protein